MTLGTDLRAELRAVCLMHGLNERGADAVWITAWIRQDPKRNVYYSSSTKGHSCAEAYGIRAYGDTRVQALEEWHRKAAADPEAIAAWHRDVAKARRLVDAPPNAG